VVVVGLVVVVPVVVEPVVVVPPDVVAALAGAGFGAVDPLSSEPPPQPAIATATAIAAAAAPILVLRSIISFPRSLSAGNRRLCEGYEGPPGRVRSTRAARLVERRDSNLRSWTRLVSSIAPGRF
jgi:hypothetical protein